MQHGEDDQRKECEETRAEEGQLRKVLEVEGGLNYTGSSWEPCIGTVSLAPCRGATSEEAVARLRNLFP